MRRYLLLLLCIAAVNKVRAQYDTYFYLKPASLVVSSPLGAFAKKGTGADIPGRVKMGYGAEGYSQRVIAKGFMAGLGYRIVDYGQRSAVTEKAVYDQYDRPGFYTDVSSSLGSATITSFYIQVAKEISISQFSIIPFFQTGLGLYADNHSIKIHHKKANENYWKDTHIYESAATSTNAQIFFYPRFGFNTGTRLYKSLYLVGGVSYGWGKVNTNIRIITADFDEKGTDDASKYQYRVSELSAVVGVELRFHKKRP